MTTQAGGHFAERGERLGGAPSGVLERSLDPVEFVAETGVFANQIVEFGFEIGSQSVQRGKMHLLLEREVRVERATEAVERLPYLDGIASFEHAQRGRLERVEVAMLRSNAPSLMGKPKAESRLVAMRHIARNSIAVL
jgi:hypothetical protein